MSRTHSENSSLPVILATLFLAFSGLVYFSGSYKLLTLLAGICCICLLLRRDLSPLRSLPALMLLTYVGVSELTRLWAISGKFFLAEFSEIFVASTLFLAVMLHRSFSRSTVRGIMQILTGVSAVYSLLSVEAATTGISKAVLRLLLPGFAGVTTSFETGTRLTGIIGNANILSSVLALGILCGICLICGEENRKTQLIFTGLTALNAFVFLLLFSMGGMACFIVSVLCYLIFAGQNRSSALVRMLECALPTVVWVFIAFPFFNQEGSGVVIPLAAMAGNIVTVILLEKMLGARMTELLSRHGKLTIGVFAGVIALACVYVVLGISLTGAHTFSGEGLRRSAYPVPGEHTLSIQADGEVNVSIISQDMSQVMMHTETALYYGSADNAVFTVPENSKVCYFTFSAPDGTVLEEASLDSGESLKLKYTLLPGFIANRLQGLAANQNAIQRTVFFRDGMKMFRQSPIVGNGVGSFETGITSVQEFLYTTKYIHNHYIQILLEAGILGCLPFVGALLGMVWLLLKRRNDTDWEFTAEYPALWACLVMIMTHIFVEVSMSIILFTWMAFVVFALVIRCCAPVTEWSVSKKIPVRGAFLLLPVVFVLTLGGNMLAKQIVTSSVRSVNEFFQRLELSAALDAYEANDAKLTYIIQAYNQDENDRIPQANEYAQELLQVQSNTIPSVLMEYYLYTGQREKALEAVQAAITYSASNPAVWNQVSSMMASNFLDSLGSPLLSEKYCQEWLNYMLDHYGKLIERNSSSMETIVLDTVSKDFFSRVLAVSKTDLNRDAVLSVLYYYLFDSSATCDADQNLIPDQAVSHSGVTFTEDSWSYAPQGSVTLQMIGRTSQETATITILCEQPEALTVLDNSGSPIQGTVSNGQWTGQFMQNASGDPVNVTISSAAAQTLSHIQILSDD